jgi:hypothetical protein
MGAAVKVMLQCPSHGHHNLAVLGLQPTQVQKGRFNSELLHERGEVINSAANLGCFTLRRFDCKAAFSTFVLRVAA